MTDEQIVKALERCGNIGLCRDCPYYHFNSKRGLGCHNNLMLDALDLIKRQQAEIERLEAVEVGNKTGSLGAVASFIDEKERLVRAKNEWEREVRSKTIKEFAERLKKKAYLNNYCVYVVTNDEIDNLVKEMTEEIDHFANVGKMIGMEDEHET